MGDWQPIETAPKDGTVIGVWSRKERGIVRMVRWGFHLGMKPHPGWVTATHGLVITNYPELWIALPPGSPPTPQGQQGESK